MSEKRSRKISSCYRRLKNRLLNRYGRFNVLSLSDIQIEYIIYRQWIQLKRIYEFLKLWGIILYRFRILSFPSHEIYLRDLFDPNPSGTGDFGIKMPRDKRCCGQWRMCSLYKHLGLQYYSSSCILAIVPTVQYIVVLQWFLCVFNSF